MKKVISTVLISAILFQPYLFAAEDGAYSFYPSKIYKPKDGEVFRKAQKLIDIAPYRPLVVRDKQGNTMYTTSNGRVMVSVDKAGNKTYSISGRKSLERNAKGKLTKKWKRTGGSNKVEVLNEFGETISSQELGLGGKVMKEYDEKGNLTKSFEYNKYGKRMEWMVDELTQSKTKFNELGQAVYDMNFEGYKTATYEYDKRGNLKSKTDNYGNKTIYDKKGNMVETYEADGTLLNVYNYAKNEQGYEELVSVKNVKLQETTIYENGKTKEIRDASGKTIRDYKWLGTKLIYVEDKVTNYVTWFDNGKAKYTTYDGYLVSQWFYHDGKIAGVWNVQEQTLSLYSRGREAIKLSYPTEPTIEQILKEYKRHGFDI